MSDDRQVIFSYTRVQALSDGVLVDVTGTAREAGFRFPVALTQTVWGGYVRVPDGVEAQDEAGRLWDILWLLLYAIRKSDSSGDTLFFTLLVRNETCVPELVTLKAVCGPDDGGHPCLTIMLPDED